MHALTTLGVVGEGHVDAQSRAIRGVVRHGLDDAFSRRAHDPRRLNDLTTAQSIGVARTVNPFMVLQG